MKNVRRHGFGDYISAEALRVAQNNARRLRVFGTDGISERKRVRSLRAGNQVYFGYQQPSLHCEWGDRNIGAEVKEFDPREALAGGPEGLDFYRLLAAKAGEFLEAGGKILLEFGDGQEESVRKIFEQEMWIVEEVIADYNQKPRILSAHRDQVHPVMLRVL